MSLPSIILNLLSKKEMTGYEINASLDGLYWSASHQQVYRELEALRKKGFVSFRDEPQEGKPDKKIFNITLTGEIVLNQWVTETIKPEGYRHLMSAKLMASESNPEGFRNNLVSYYDNLYEQFQEIRKSLEFDKLDKLTELCLIRKKLQIEAELSWVRQVLEVIK